MGCWGITALESDAGLDAVAFIRKKLPVNGKLELEQIIKDLKQDSWNAPPNAENAESHTSPMAVTEMIVKFINRDMEGLDYEWEEEEKEIKFSDITSFTTSKESIKSLREYLSQSLDAAKLNAENNNKWNGWFKEADWIKWQEHMKSLINQMDRILLLRSDNIDLITLQDQKNEQVMG